MSEEKIELRRDVNGLEMGVLSDGTVFLSGRSLAKLCGIAPSTISFSASTWAAGKRDGKLAQMLIAHGIERDSLYPLDGKERVTR